MTEVFDSAEIAKRGWRQGAILGDALAKLARECSPRTVDVDNSDWLVLTSHDCDIVNASIDKEPVVEVLRMSVAAIRKVDRRQSWGRNPRTFQLASEAREAPVVLSCSVHDRWTIPRALLMQERPAACLPDKERRLVAEWLAKRYIRAAFPTEFDRRWRSKLKDWQKLLRKHSEWMQGVYLRLDTLGELPTNTPYRCHLIVAVPHSKRGRGDSARRQVEIEEEVQAFWDQFESCIECTGVDVLGTDEITLADIEPYQRFDVDWVSFEDETAMTPSVVDMASQAALPPESASFP